MLSHTFSKFSNFFYNDKFFICEPFELNNKKYKLKELSHCLKFHWICRWSTKYPLPLELFVFSSLHWKQIFAVWRCLFEWNGANDRTKLNYQQWMFSNPHMILSMMLLLFYFSPLNSYISFGRWMINKYICEMTEFHCACNAKNAIQRRR